MCLTYSVIDVNNVPRGPGTYNSGPQKGQRLRNEAPPYVSFRFTSDEWEGMKAAVEPSISWLEGDRAAKLEECMGPEHWPELFRTLSWRNLMSKLPARTAAHESTPPCLGQ